MHCMQCIQDKHMKVRIPTMCLNMTLKPLKPCEYANQKSTFITQSRVESQLHGIPVLLSVIIVLTNAFVACLNLFNQEYCNISEAVFV